MSICFHISCVEKCFHSILFWLKVLYFSVFTLVLIQPSELLAPPASTFWVTAVALATWCNAQILLDGLSFRFVKLKRLVGLVREKKHSHFRCANVRGLCGSIHRNLLFYYSASDIRFTFLCSVWKGLKAHSYCLHLQNVFQTHVCSYNLHTPNSVCKPLFSRQMWLKAGLQQASLSEQVNRLPQLVWIMSHAADADRLACFEWATSQGPPTGRGLHPPQGCGLPLLSWLWVWSEE